MNIRKNLLPNSLKSWKFPYKMTPTRIVVHNTANDASADNEVKYMHKTKAQGGKQVSYHYAVDDKEVVQAIEECYNGFHATDGAKGKGNREGIAIEICYSKSGGERFDKAEKNAVKLIVDILKRYGWGIDKVTKHQDYTNKYCPHRTLDLGWERFLNMVRDELGQAPVKKSEPVVTPVNTTSYNGSSIVDALNSVGVDSSFGNRKKIAQLNGINSYKGTANQNMTLLNLFKTGRLVYNTSSGVKETPSETLKCNYAGASLVDALKSISVDSSFSYRSKLAKKNGISGYIGTASQNSKLLNLLKQGKLLKA